MMKRWIFHDEIWEVIGICKIGEKIGCRVQLTPIGYSNLVAGLDSEILNLLYGGAMHHFLTGITTQSTSRLRQMAGEFSIMQAESRMTFSINCCLW